MTNQFQAKTALFHLPGLFSFYEFYRVFLPLFRNHREYFYDWCDIGSIYGAPAGCLWGGGRVSSGTASPEKALTLTREYGISARLTFSNSLLTPEHLSDGKCNRLCALFSTPGPVENGVIVSSDLLLAYLARQYPGLYFVSSTTKVLTDFTDLQKELSRSAFRYVVPDFRLNKALEKFNALSPAEKTRWNFSAMSAAGSAAGSGKPATKTSAGKIWGFPAPTTAAPPRTATGVTDSPGQWKIPGLSAPGISTIFTCPWAFPTSKLKDGSWAALCCWNFCCTT